MLPSASGNVHLPFARLMRLETLDQDTFRSIAIPFSPGEGHSRSHGVTYGGHVYAQAAWAAAQTIPPGFVLHNISGFFILGGVATIPFVYRVQTIRNGRSYCTRIVNVTQADGKGICFTCTCSFKIAEKNDLDVHETVDIAEKYKSVLAGKSPEDFEDAPGMDVPWYWQMQKETGHNDIFPGLESRKVDMSAYNTDKSPLDRRQLMFYRPIGDLESNINLALCAHLYASDRNSLFIVANHFDVGDTYSQMGSLVHSVIFHSPVEQMTFSIQGQKDESKNTTDKHDWYCKEDWTTRLAEGRGMFHCRIWNPNGVHIATVVQEGMIRLSKKSDPKL